MNAETMKLVERLREPLRPFYAASQVAWRGDGETVSLDDINEERRQAAEALSTPTGRVTREDDSWVLVPREPTEEMVDAYFDKARALGFIAHMNASCMWETMISAAPALEGEGDSSGAESAASPIASGVGTATDAQRKSEDGANADFRSDVPDVEEVIRYLRDFGPGTTDSTDLYFMRWAADHLCNLVSLVDFWRAQAALTAYPPPSPDAEPSAAGGA